MKRFLNIVGFVAVLTISAMANEHITSIEEYERVTKSGNVIIDFYAPKCAPCKELAISLKKLKIDTKNVKIYKVNVAKNPDLQARYAQPMVPTILYMKDGRLIDGYIGSKTTTQLKEDIENYFY